MGLTVTCLHENAKLIGAEEILGIVRWCVPEYLLLIGDGKLSLTQQAKINLMQSEIKRNEISENLKLQVSTAKNKYQFALDQYQTTKENLTLAESIADKEQIKFFEGLSTSIDLTNTQNQLYGSQQNYIQSILEIIQSKVELENALNLF